MFVAWGIWCLAKHHISQATNIPYQPLLIKPYLATSSSLKRTTQATHLLVPILHPKHARPGGPGVVVLLADPGRFFQQLECRDTLGVLSVKIVGVSNDFT